MASKNKKKIVFFLDLFVLRHSNIFAAYEERFCYGCSFLLRRVFFRIPFIHSSSFILAVIIASSYIRKKTLHLNALHSIYFFLSPCSLLPYMQHAYFVYRSGVYVQPFHHHQFDWGIFLFACSFHSFARCLSLLWTNAIHIEHRS